MIFHSIYRSCSDVKEIDDVAHISQLSTLQSLVADLTRVNKRLNDTKRDKTDDLKVIKKRKADIILEISVTKKRLVAHLDALERKIIAELDVKLNKLEAELKAEIAVADDLITTCDKRKPDLTSNYDKKQMFIIGKLGKVVLDDVFWYFNNAALSLRPFLKFDPNVQLINTVHHSSRMGNIIGRKHFTVKSMRETSIRVSSNKLPSVLPKKCWIKGMCQLPDGTILLIDFNYNKLKRLDNELNVKDFYDLDDKPKGMCSVSSTEVAVRLNDNTIHYIYVGQSLTFQRKFPLKCFNRARSGMAFVDDHLWISGDKAVYIYTLDGSFVKKLETDSEGQKIFVSNDPRHIDVSLSKTKVFVTAGDNRIVVFSTGGDVINELTDHRLNQVESVCVTEDDVVLVCGGISKNIVMFGGDEERLGELVASGDMKSNPTSMCYDYKNSRLLVGYVNLDEIQIFQLNE